MGSLVFAIGLIGLLIGALTDVYTTTIGVIIMLAIWFVGGAIVGLAMGGKKEEPPKPPEEPQQPQQPEEPQQPEQQ